MVNEKCFNRLCNQDCKRCLEVRKKSMKKSTGKPVRMDDLNYFKKLWNEVEKSVKAGK